MALMINGGRGFLFLLILRIDCIILLWHSLGLLYNLLWRIEDTTEMFLDEKRDGLVDENRVNNKENKNNRAVFMLYLFAYNIRPVKMMKNDAGVLLSSFLLQIRANKKEQFFDTIISNDTVF